MRTVAIIQARMGSTRLPGKTLVDIAGRPMLAHVVERARASKCIDDIVIATSDDAVEKTALFISFDILFFVVIKSYSNISPVAGPSISLK